MELQENDYKELFELFSSLTKYELEKIYDKKSDKYFKNTDLNDEYELAESKIAFSQDCWRAVIYFLYKRGFRLIRGKEITDLDFIEEYFL